MDNLDVLEFECVTVNLKLPEIIDRFKQHGLDLYITSKADIDLDAELRMRDHKDLFVQVTLDLHYVVQRVAEDDEDFCMYDIGEYRSIASAAEALLKEIKKKETV